ncbi:PmoA family protein [Glycomyces arizonensis]|uniref:DUF6807 domain-containing protein n=1 Tax=Glycomyces arizonensis TaxID=256035 RepID=UPI00040358FB|nr:PmoA family protein [Glycomyces arizonensis]
MSDRAERRSLRLGGRRVADYVWRPRLPGDLSPRPYLHPVRTMAGTAVTDVMPEDHRHHLGVSVAVPDVGGANFWGGRTFVAGRGSVPLPNHGVQHHRRWESADEAALVHELRWTGTDGADLLRERRRIAAVPLGDRAWALDFGFDLVNATDAPLAFASPAVNGRPGAGYGGFFWRAGRGERSVRVTGPGVDGERGLHGARTAWLALHAAGARAWTLVFLADERAGDPWFVRSGDYVGVGSSLAWSEPLVAAPGEGPRRRIITVVVDGDLGPRETASTVAAVRAATSGEA